MRYAETKRKTTETDIKLSIELDGSGIYSVSTGCGFFDHMLELFARHGRFDLNVVCKGDIKVDCHHSVEDTGIALGNAFRQAVGKGRGITRYGSVILPMDEALVLCAADLSGRGHCSCLLEIPSPRIGAFDSELAEEFFTAFCRSASVTMHLRQLDGRNSHHIVEAAFKAAARALRQAVAIDPAFADEIPSTKGVL